MRTSSRFEQVSKALIGNLDKGYNPRIGKGANGGKYNSANDNKISIPNYLEWLSKDHSMDVQKKEQTTTKSRIKEDQVPTNPHSGGGQPENTGNKRGRL